MFIGLFRQMVFRRRLLRRPILRRPWAQVKRVYTVTVRAIEFDIEDKEYHINWDVPEDEIARDFSKEEAEWIAEGIFNPADIIINIPSGMGSIEGNNTYFGIKFSPALTKTLTYDGYILELN